LISLSSNANQPRRGTASFNLPLGRRQFTGQEQIPNVGLVNMNGRLYDPSLGRFLSPDPNVQSAADLQSFNRYSYVRNNPLRYADPTGYFWSEVGGFFKTYFSDPWNDIQLAATLGACAVSGVACVALALYFTAVNSSIAISSGAGFGETILNAGIGLGVGFATGGLAQEFGLAGWQALILGSASAAVTTGITNVISGRDFFDYNVLGAAMLSAATGAAALGLQKVATVSQASAETAQGDAPEAAPNCNKQCQAAIQKAFEGNPLAKSMDGTIYFELTGETGGNEFKGEVKGLPKATLRPWAVDRIQRIFDELHLKYDVSKTVLYIGGSGKSLGFGAIRLNTPGTDFGMSFLRTGRQLLHEMGHQALAVQNGGWDKMMIIWRAEKAAVGGQYAPMYEIKGYQEYQADQFANTYLPRLVR
jgi:RHS repeat-associated protein